MTPTTDQLIDGELIHLPPEAGDVNEPRFNPNEEWMRNATPAEQKTAMWRWFATRYEDPITATPHDDKGNYEYKDGGPYFVDKLLHERFDAFVPAAVVEELAQRVRQKGGNEWGLKGMDKFGG